MNLLNKEDDSKFVTRKWNMVYNHSNANYDVGNEIIYKTEVSKSNLCDYNNTCILVKGDINNVGHNLATKITVKTCTPFTKCVTKMNGRTIDDAEDLDLVILMYIKSKLL